jgi:hypothetical protein
VASRHLAVFLVDPATRFDLGVHCICATKAGLDVGTVVNSTY